MQKLLRHGMGMFLAVALAGGCAQDASSALGQQQSPILGGTQTTVGQYPTVIALIVGNGLCTGTLVAPNVVVTAAHCVLPSEVGVSTQAQVTSSAQILFDATDTGFNGGSPTPGSQTFTASSTAPNPSFNINTLGSHDIGIVVLSKRVTDRNPSPIERDTSNPNPNGALVTLVGYGISQVGNQGSAGTEFALTNKATVRCSIAGATDSNMICFDQSDGKGSCSGDSGGPAFFKVGGKDAVAGMTSYGDQNCQNFGAYTRLSAELTFFETQMKAANACAADGICTPACGAGTLPADPDCSGMPTTPDAMPIMPGNPDAMPIHPGTPDAAPVQPGTPDANHGHPGAPDAAPGNPQGNPGGDGGSPGLFGGCTVAANGSTGAGSSSTGSALALGMLGLALAGAIARRRARR